MARRPATVAEMMTLVAFAAVNCMAIPVADHFAGAWVVGIALQVGFIFLLRSQGRERRLWVGFEVVGVSLLTAFLACKSLFRPTIFRWPAWLFDNRFSPININDELMIYEMVILFEVAYGLPMLLLALSGGLLFAFAVRERPGPTALHAWYDCHALGVTQQVL